MKPDKLPVPIQPNEFRHGSPIPEPVTEKAPMKRERYADYIEAIIEPISAKWVTDGFTCDRRIALYGIKVCVSLQLNGKVELSPVIPCAGPLADLVRKRPDKSAFRFDEKKRKWGIAKDVRP